MGKNIEGVELLVFSKTNPDKKGNWKKIRVVQWFVDGTAVSVKLEKRAFFLNDDKEERMGKAEGLSLADLDSLKPHWQAIMKLMKNPPEVKPREPEPAQEGAEESPF